MHDGEDLDGPSRAERELAQRLNELGGLMRELHHAESEIDETFARTLRAHLLQGEEVAPHPTFARRLRTHLLHPTGARSVPRPRQRFLGGLGVVAVVVGILSALLFNHPNSAGFQAPYPTRADLRFNLPASAHALSRLTPTLSLVHPSSAAAFAGPVRVAGPRPSQVPFEVHAYRLASRPGVPARDRRLLAIQAPVRRVAIGRSIWLVAADGRPGSHRLLHSLAVSLGTGELIYHDRRNFRLPSVTRPVTQAVAARVARHWLTELGWPGRVMPLRAFGSVSGYPRVRRVVLGWRGVGPATIQEATLWITPNHSIIEAWVWPPVTQAGSVATRSAGSAWNDVISGRAPSDIQGVDSGVRATARATLRRLDTVLILVPGAHGTTYLVPAYRFEGTAQVGTTDREHPWLSLAPGAGR